MTRIDSKSKQRIPRKCILDYDFDVTLDKNIKVMLNECEFRGTTSYTLCMERTLINKPYEELRKNLLVDLHAYKEEFLNKVILSRELYYLVPISLISSSRVLSPEKQISSSDSSEVIPEKK